MIARSTAHAAPGAQETPAPPAGTLVLIGGALDADATIVSRIVELAAQRRADAAPRIAIFTTASEPAASAASAHDPLVDNDQADGEYYAEVFAQHGAVGVPIPVGVSPAPSYPGGSYFAAQAASPEIAELVRSCDGVFLGGGDQTHYVLALFQRANSSRLGKTGDPNDYPFDERHGTPVLAAIHTVLDRGGVVAGTSAGLAVQQGAGMVSGGADIHNAWKHGATPGYEITREGRDALSFVPAGGLGLFTEAPLDSHFSEWGRQPRAIRLARALGRSTSVGVDEHTALVYDRRTRVAEVIGHRGVSILNLSASESVADDAVTGTRWSYLVSGDSYNFATAATVHGSGRAELELSPTAAASAAEDAWADDGTRPLLALAQQLVTAPASTQRGAGSESASGESAADRTPRYRTTLSRDERTIAHANGGFTDLLISITTSHPST